MRTVKVHVGSTYEQDMAKYKTLCVEAETSRQIELTLIDGATQLATDETLLNVSDEYRRGFEDAVRLLEDRRAAINECFERNNIEMEIVETKGETK